MNHMGFNAQKIIAEGGECSTAGGGQVSHLTEFPVSSGPAFAGVYQGRLHTWGPGGKYLLNVRRPSHMDLTRPRKRGEKTYIATSSTTGGEGYYFLTDEQYRIVHQTHPAWFGWREVHND